MTQNSANRTILENCRCLSFVEKGTSSSALICQKKSLAKIQLLCIEPTLRCCAHNSTQTIRVECQPPINVGLNSHLRHISANQPIIKNPVVCRVELFWLASSSIRWIDWYAVTPRIELADLLNNNGRILCLQ